MNVIRKEIVTTPDKTTDFIVSEMWRLSNRDSKDPAIVRRASSLKGKNKKETTQNIFNYVVKKVPYVADPPDREQITAPIHLENGDKVGGDCDCQVTLLSSLLTAAGIENRIMTIAWRMKQFTHVVLEAKPGFNWIVLDPTRGFGGYGKTIPKHLDKIKRREKRYKNPMIVETLNDGGCGCNQSLNDCGGNCGCGGKCGKSGRKAKNYNNNVNNIVIGNELLQPTNLRFNNQSGTVIPQPKTTKIVNDEGEERRVIELKRRKRKTKEVVTTHIIPDGIFY